MRVFACRGNHWPYNKACLVVLQRSLVTLQEGNAKDVCHKARFVEAPAAELVCKGPYGVGQYSTHGHYAEKHQGSHQILRPTKPKQLEKPKPSRVPQAIVALIWATVDLFFRD